MIISVTLVVIYKWCKFQPSPLEISLWNLPLQYERSFSKTIGIVWDLVLLEMCRFYNLVIWPLTSGKRAITSEKEKKVRLVENLQVFFILWKKWVKKKRLAELNLKFISRMFREMLSSNPLSSRNKTHCSSVLAFMDLMTFSCGGYHLIYYRPFLKLFSLTLTIKRIAVLYNYWLLFVQNARN